MKGCEHCNATVRKYEFSEIADDEICFVCDTKLMDVKDDLGHKLVNWRMMKEREYAEKQERRKRLAI